ncbi:MAG TPA: CHRD domain-containing protein [Tepidisphaeraceae bacterium]|nr:CHRD domain-containing protein [Tepidisphaeraceae bacterium]
MSLKNVVWAVGFAVILSCSCAWAATSTLEANLDGLQEVPPNGSPAYGFGSVTLNDVTDMVTVTMGNYNGLLGASAAATINDAAPGTGGPTILTLTLDVPGTTTGTFSGGGMITAGQATDMLAGNTYINIRSSVFPSGEIRGQLFVVPEPASLSLIGAATLLTARRKRNTSL